VGDSIVDENASELLAGLDLNSSQLLIPKDFNIFENKILDIGPKTIREFSDIIKNSKIVIRNGPMGLFEDEKFTEGTRAIAQAIAESSAQKIIGGGDTISAINKFGFNGRFDFVSTGGGAMLAFLAGEELPGLKNLGYYV
jgi:phosphoglycerate kinase